MNGIDPFGLDSFPFQGNIPPIAMEGSYSNGHLSLTGASVVAQQYTDPIKYLSGGLAPDSGGLAGSISTVNPVTSGHGFVEGYNIQNFNGNFKKYRYSGNGTALDIGAAIEAVFAWGSGPWSGDFRSFNLSFAYFAGSIFWTPGENGWWGITLGTGFGLPGLAFEETDYIPCE